MKKKKAVKKIAKLMNEALEIARNYDHEIESIAMFIDDGCCHHEAIMLQNGDYLYRKTDWKEL